MNFVFFNLQKGCSLVLGLMLFCASFSCRATLNSEFFEAAKSGDLSQVSRLFGEGANIDARNSDGMTALHASVTYGFNSTLSFNPTFMMSGKYLSVVKFLLDHGADVNATGGFYYLTPLYEAAHYGFRDAAELLIARGAKVDARSTTGSTPLLAASRYGFIGVSDLLISKGADFNAKDNYGWTALHNASIFREREEYIRFMLAKGADVNARRFDGQTPLHRAAEHQVEEIAVLLISNGADVAAKDNAGDTPYDIARKNMSSDFGLLFRPTNVNARPAFDCSHENALNYVEWHVCRFPPLTALDLRLNDAYLAALNVAKQPKNLRDEQREWIRERNQLCKTENYTCSMPKLMHMYETRIERLDQIVGDPSIADNRDICITLAQRADKTGLKDLAVRASRNPTDQELAEFEGTGVGQPNGIYELQLNRSVPAEKFGQFSTGGTCASTQIFNIRRILESKGESNGWKEVGDPDDIIRWAYWGGGDYPIKYQGQYFMITSDLTDDNRVNMISSIKSDGAILPICTVEEASFKYVTDPGSNDLCSKIAQGSIDPIRWKSPDVDLASSRDEFVAKYSTYADSVVVARIDLDGDGVPENVGRFAYSSGAGCGSERVWGRVLSNNFQNTVKGRLDDLISQLGGPFEIYQQGRNYYLRMAVSRNIDQVVRVREGRVEKVCELHRRAQSRPKVLFEAN